MNRFSRFISGLRAGDAAIAGLLGFFVVIMCFIGFTGLLRAFQVSIPAYGGTLYEGEVGSPRFANPLLAISDNDRDMVQLTYAGLMGHAADGQLIPVLASSYTVSTDGTIYTFTLRPNLTFSDGSPVTADDVVYTIQKAQDPALKSPVYASWSNIRAEAIDTHTVRFTLPKAYAPFLEDTTLGILPKHLWQNISDDEFPFASYDSMPVGAGPFVATGITRDSSGTITGYTLSSFSKYALGAPYLAHIKLSFYETAEELQAAYKKGTIESMYGVAVPGVTTAPYSRVFAVFFNTDKNPELSDLGVRTALSLAVDRTSLTKDLLGGYATPLSGPLPAGSTVPVVPTPDDTTRIANAKDALTRAGYIYTPATNTWTKKGQVLSIKLTTSNVPELKAVASAVQKNWEDLGVQVQLELTDSSSLTQSVIRPRAYEALLFGEVVGTTPDLYAFWHSSERTDPGLNIAGYTDASVDALLEEARTQTDPATETQTLSQIQTAIAADYPAAFLYTPDFLYKTQPNIHGIALSAVGSPSDRFWGVTSWYRYSEYVWPIFVPSGSAGKNQ